MIISASLTSVQSDFLQPGRKSPLVDDPDSELLVFVEHSRVFAALLLRRLDLASDDLPVLLLGSLRVLAAAPFAKSR